MSDDRIKETVKPLLLIDVDGPLSPFDAPWFDSSTPPGDFRFYDLSPSDGETYRVALSDSHGAELDDLQDAYDLAWATTWRYAANRLISPILGLPRNLPVIPLVRPRGPGTRRSWKVEQIADWAGPRPFAWFDDEINRATRDWLKKASWLGPHLALRIPASVGLTEPDFERIWAFADNV